MKKLLKVLAVLVGILVAGAAVGVAGLYAWSGAELKKKAPLPSHAFAAPTDSASIARGEHLTRAIVKCGDCHGQDMGGQVMIDDAAFMKLFAPNLTRGEGGIASSYDDAAWERAVRHGVAKDGRRLLIMPSNEYQFISDEDLGMVVAYLKQVPAVSRSHPAPTVGPVARALVCRGPAAAVPAKCRASRRRRGALGGRGLDRCLRQVPRRCGVLGLPRRHVRRRRDPRDAARLAGGGEPDARGA